MALRQCDKCTEMVDEAKAFCPACGNAFVEEEHRSISTNFEEMDSTVQLGQTMYNQMLTDIGLNISKATDPVERKIEVLAPEPVVVAPAAQAAAPQAAKPASSKIVWIIIGAAVALILLAMVVVIVAAGFVYYMAPRAT